MVTADSKYRQTHRIQQLLGRVWPKDQLLRATEHQKDSKMPFCGYAEPPQTHISRKVCVLREFLSAGGWTARSDRPKATTKQAQPHTLSVQAKLYGILW